MSRQNKSRSYYPMDTSSGFTPGTPVTSLRRSARIASNKSREEQIHSSHWDEDVEMETNPVIHSVNNRKSAGNRSRSKKVDYSSFPLAMITVTFNDQSSTQPVYHNITLQEIHNAAFQIWSDIDQKRVIAEWYLCTNDNCNMIVDMVNNYNNNKTTLVDFLQKYNIPLKSHLQIVYIVPLPQRHSLKLKHEEEKLREKNRKNEEQIRHLERERERERQREAEEEFNKMKLQQQQKLEKEQKRKEVEKELERMEKEQQKRREQRRQEYEREREREMMEKERERERMERERERERMEKEKQQRKEQFNYNSNYNFNNNRRNNNTTFVENVADQIVKELIKTIKASKSDFNLWKKFKLQLQKIYSEANCREGYKNFDFHVDHLIQTFGTQDQHILKFLNQIKIIRQQNPNITSEECQEIQKEINGEQIPNLIAQKKK